MKATIANALIGGIGFMLTTPILNAAPKHLQEVEGWLFPVVTNVQMFEIDTEGDDLRFHVFGTKVRNCELLGREAFVISGGTTLEVKIDYGNDRETSINPYRSLGRQDFGIWRFRINDIYQIEEVYTVARHKCFMPWDTLTEMGRFKLNHKEAT